VIRAETLEEPLASRVILPTEPYSRQAEGRGQLTPIPAGQSGGLLSAFAGPVTFVIAHRYSFLVGVFHSQLHAGLSRRTYSTLASEAQWVGFRFYTSGIDKRCIQPGPGAQPPGSIWITDLALGAQ
jgi:hypothetical protein